MTTAIDPKSNEITERKWKLKSEAEALRLAAHKNGTYPFEDLEYRSKITAKATERIKDTYRRLIDYHDTEYKHLARPAIFWPDGTSLGFGFAAHMCGSAQQFYRTFEYWGFKDLTEFYSLPRDLRNRFMDEAVAYWKALFGEDGRKLREIIVHGHYISNTKDVTPNTATRSFDDDPVVDVEYTLRAGLLHLAEVIKTEARKGGWDEWNSRKKAESEFRRPFGFSPGYSLRRAFGRETRSSRLELD